MDWSTIKPDPSVGAVLCGFDAYVSESLISERMPQARQARG